MKTEEDEAFDDLAKKQGAWGGGFKAKQAMAADKLWDKPSVAFDEWWNGDNDESTNPFRLESGAYWAWAGWKAALAQPAQEPVALYAAPPQRPWKKLTEEERASFDAANPKTREEWDELFDGIALAQPAQEPEWYHGVDQHGCNRFYHKTEVRPKEFSTQLYTTPPRGAA